MDKQTPIFVSGGTGFLGSYLLRYLVHYGYKNIRAIRRSSSDLSLIGEAARKIEWLEGDLLDPLFLEEAMAGAQRVYHCAAVVSFDPRDRKKMMAVNVAGTTNIVNAALYLGVDKFVHVSSISALGKKKNQAEVDEKTNWVRDKSNSNYAISKYLSEQEVWRGMAEGLKVAVVNPSVILGSGRWDDGPLKLFKLVWNNFPFYTQGGTGFVDVRDVARFMIQLMESEYSAERYILNADNLSFKQLLHNISEHLGKKPPRLSAPPIIQQLVWRWEWLRARLFGGTPIITRETAAAAKRSFRYLNHKSKAAFDFEYIPIGQTIREASRQFREAAENEFEAKALPLL